MLRHMVVALSCYVCLFICCSKLRNKSYGLSAAGYIARYTIHGYIVVVETFTKKAAERLRLIKGSPD